MVAPLPPLRGGVSDFSAGLASALKDEVSLEVLTFRSVSPDALHPDGRAGSGETADVTVLRALDWRDPLGWLLSGSLVQADVLHLQHWSLQLIPVLLIVALMFRLRNKKVVVTLHNVRSHELSPGYVAGTALLCLLAHRCVVHWQGGIEEARKVLGIRGEKVVRIPLGVSLPGAPDAPDRAAARRDLGLPPDAPVVLCAGRISPYKGLPVMLRAMPRLLQQVPDAVLLVAGKPSEAWESYASLIEELGIGDNVKTILRYLDHPELSRCFAAADVVVLPYTRFAAQSGVGSQAVGFGKALVVADVGALPELVEDNRMIVAPGDWHALAQRVALCLANPGLRARLEDASRRLAAERSWKNVAARTADLYRSLCTERYRD